MTRYVGRIEPFETNNTRAWKASDSSFHLRDILFEFRNDGACLLGASCRSPYRANIRAHIRNRMRVERDDLWLSGQMRERRTQIVRRGGADVAKVLRDDQIRLNRAQRGQIHTIEALAAFEKFADLAVNGCSALRVRNARHDQNRFGARLRREIALVADSGDLVHQAPRHYNFRRGGQT